MVSVVTCLFRNQELLVQFRLEAPQLIGLYNGRHIRNNKIEQ